MKLARWHSVSLAWFVPLLKPVRFHAFKSEADTGVYLDQYEEKGKKGGKKVGSTRQGIASNNSGEGKKVAGI